MKRIALIRNSYSFDFGGGEIIPINLAKILVLKGYKPIVVSSHKKTLSTAKNEKLETKRSPWWSFQNFSGLYTLLFPVYLAWVLILTAWYSYYFLRNRIDVVHPQSRDDFVAATLAGRLLNRNVIWTDHADLKYIYQNHAVLYKNPVGKLVYAMSRFAEYVTIESNSEKKLIEQSLGKLLPQNYVVIHIGVVDAHKPVKRNNKKVVFVSTSRLVKAKGIGELIEAFKLMDDANAVLRLCGDGPDAAHFKALAEGVQNIEFLGHVNNVANALETSDVFVHPTYREGFGLSLVEAEMCSLPIIASNIDSIPEIVQDGVSGILVKPRDTEDLAKAMAELMTKPKQRVRMGMAGRQIYLNNFQFDKIVEERFIPLYEAAKN